MTKTEIKKKHKYILDRVIKFTTAMNLSHYEPNVIFMGEDEDNLNANVFTDSDYLRFTIRIYPMLVEESNKEIDKTIIHELVHVILDRITNMAWESQSNATRDIYKQINESTTEHIARLIASKL